MSLLLLKIGLAIGPAIFVIVTVIVTAVIVIKFLIVAYIVIASLIDGIKFIFRVLFMKFTFHHLSPKERSLSNIALGLNVPYNKGRYGQQYQDLGYVNSPGYAYRESARQVVPPGPTSTRNQCLGCRSFLSSDEQCCHMCGSDQILHC